MIFFTKSTMTQVIIGKAKARTIRAIFRKAMIETDNHEKVIQKISDWFGIIEHFGKAPIELLEFELETIYRGVK